MRMWALRSALRMRFPSLTKTHWLHWARMFVLKRLQYHWVVSLERRSADAMVKSNLISFRKVPSGLFQYRQPTLPLLRQFASQHRQSLVLCTSQPQSLSSRLNPWAFSLNKQLNLYNSSTIDPCLLVDWPKGPQCSTTIVTAIIVTQQSTHLQWIDQL